MWVSALVSLQRKRSNRLIINIQESRINLSSDGLLLNCWNAPLMSVVGVEIIMLGPLPGIKYWTDDALFAPALPPSPDIVLLFNGVVVGVRVALLLTFTLVAIAQEVVGYTLPPFRIKYC